MFLHFNYFFSVGVFSKKIPGPTRPAQRLFLFYSVAFVDTESIHCSFRSRPSLLFIEPFAGKKQFLRNTQEYPLLNFFGNVKPSFLTNIVEVLLYLVYRHFSEPQTFSSQKGTATTFLRTVIWKSLTKN